MTYACCENCGDYRALHRIMLPHPRYWGLEMAHWWCEPCCKGPPMPTDDDIRYMTEMDCDRREDEQFGGHG